MTNASRTPNRTRPQTSSGARIDPDNRRTNAEPGADVANFKPAKITFLSGPYKGQVLGSGTAIAESRSSQTANWTSQEGHGIRVAKTFRNISARSFSLTLEFYSPDQDISPLVENVMHLQELDVETQEPARLHYQEGETSVAPLVCLSINPQKKHPFPGGKGFHYATVQISLELLGGRASEHRLAKPLTTTALSEYAESVTRAQRERQGRAAAAKVALADCLTDSETEQIEGLVRDDQTNDVGRVRGLSNNALIQASIGGLIPADTLGNVDGKMRSALAERIAISVPGVGENNRVLVIALSQAIQGQPVPLPPDIQQEVPELRVEFDRILEGIRSQRLGDLDPVMAQATTSDRIRRIGGCGLRLRQSNAPEIRKQQSGNLPGEWARFFEQELGVDASNPAARDRLILDRINDRLGKASPAEIRREFNLTDEAQAEALKNSRPYSNKDAFAEKLDAKNKATGLAAWSSFIDGIAGTSATAVTP